MNKEQLQANINRMKLEIAETETKLKAEDKETLSYSHPYYKVETTSIRERYANTNPAHRTLKHARYRDTKEQAEEALLRELQANRIEALARKLEPDWKADWHNNEQRKCTILFDHVDEEYYYEELTLVQPIGVPYMCKQTAEQICDYLNSGSYSLNMED